LFPLCFSIVVSKFGVLHQSLSSILRWFLYTWRNGHLILVFCIWYPVFPPPLVKESVLFSACFWHFCHKNQMPARVYFWVLHSIPLVWSVYLFLC
jgi:hypothetical protein